MALRLDALLNDIGYAFGRRVPVKEAKLRLGAIETVAAVQLPRLVSQFLRDSPHVDISVQTGSSSGLIKQVKAGELDAVFVSRTFRLPRGRKLVLVPLPGEIATIQTFVVSSQISESSLLVSGFVDHCRSVPSSRSAARWREE
jgi:hypothetical protein